MTFEEKVKNEVKKGNKKYRYFSNKIGDYVCEEYNDKNNLIHWKNSNGIECWNEYNIQGNIYHSIYNDEYEEWYEYDINGNITNYRNSTGFEEWYINDNDGNILRYINSNGIEYYADREDKNKENNNSTKLELILFIIAIIELLFIVLF